MIKHVFINQEKLQLILDGNKAQLRKPVGFCYDDGKPRTMFIGTKRNNDQEVHLTKGGDLQFNLKAAKEEEQAEVEAPPAAEEAPGLAERVDAQLAEETQIDEDIPF